MFNPDTSGVTLKKPRPRLADMALEPYAPCVEWVKQKMTVVGYDVTEARFDPYDEHWYFYENDFFVAKLAHATMDYIWERLRLQAATVITPSMLTNADIDQWR